MSSGIKIGDTLYTTETQIINLSDYTGLVDDNKTSDGKKKTHDQKTSDDPTILQPGETTKSPDIPDLIAAEERNDTLIQVIKLCSNSLQKLLLENLYLDDLRVTKYSRKDSLVRLKEVSTTTQGFFSSLKDGLSSIGGLVKCQFQTCKKSPEEVLNDYKQLGTKDFNCYKSWLLPQLEYLSFNSTTVNIAFIYYTLLAKKPKTLDIKTCAERGIFDQFKQMQPLDYLDLSGTNLSTTTDSKNRDILLNTDVNINDLYSIFNYIAPNLKVLKISNSNLDDPLLFYSMLNGADQLIKLIFKQNNKPNFSTPGLKFTEPFNHLKVIDLSNITATVLDPDGKPTTTEHEISQFTIHQILINSPNLEELYLANNNLKEFTSTDITNKLVELPNLKILRLDNTNITSEYLSYLLEHTPNVQVLGLNSDKLTWDIEECSIIITQLKLKELYINISNLNENDLQSIIEKIIDPIDTLKTLELPYIEEFDYGNMAFRIYDKVLLYDNNNINKILTSTDPNYSSNKKLKDLNDSIGDIKGQLNNMYNQNMGLTGGDGSSNIMMIVIVIVILLIAGVGGFLLFKFL